MQVNKSESHLEAKKIMENITNDIFNNISLRKVTHEEAIDDIDIMVKIHQLVHEMIKRRDLRRK